MYCAIETQIPVEEANNFVYLPKCLIGAIDIRRLEVAMENETQITMCADTLSHGCGGVAVSFIRYYGKWSGFPEDYYNTDGFLFGFTCTKETLGEIMHALKTIHENAE